MAGIQVLWGLELGMKSQQWFDDNPTIVLGPGQVVFLQTDFGEDEPEPEAPRFKRGDGFNELQDLIWSDQLTDGVQTVTGDGVDNTDPLNPVISFPNANQVAYGGVSVADGIDSVSVMIIDHMNDTVDAHDASAISYTPTGGLSSLNVDAAIDELESEKARFEDIQPYAVATGTNAYACAFVQGNTTFQVGKTYLVNFSNRNTGPSTLSPSGGAAVTIVKQKDLALIGDELLGIIELVYDGVNLQITNSQPDEVWVRIGFNTVNYSPLDNAVDYFGPNGSNFASVALGRQGSLPNGWITKYRVTKVYASASSAQMAVMAVREDNTIDHPVTSNLDFSLSPNITYADYYTPASPVEVFDTRKYTGKITNPAYNPTNPANILLGLDARIKLKKI